MTAPEASALAAILAALIATIGWLVSRRNAFAVEARKTRIEQRKTGMRAVHEYVDQVHGTLRDVGHHLRGPDDELASALAAANKPRLSIVGSAMIEDHDELRRLMTRFREVELECHRLVGEADRERSAGRSLQGVEDRYRGVVNELATVGREIRREGEHLERN